MRITHLGHACVLIEIDGTGVLIDPGTMSSPSQVPAMKALLFTHNHTDHLDIVAVSQLLARNTSASIVADAGSAHTLAQTGVDGVTQVDSASTVTLDVAGIPVEATTVAHASIHCDLPSPVNNTYLVAGSVLHPGDAFWVPPRPVDVLLLPIGGPWMKLSESVDYLRAVAPRVAIPIHQGGLAAAHRALHCDLLRKLGPAHTELLVLEKEQPTIV